MTQNEVETLDFFERQAPGRAGGKSPGGLGEFLRAVADGDVSRLRASIAGIGEAVPSDGGFLVGEELAAGLLARVYLQGELAKRVTRIPISRNSLGVRINALDEDSRADGSRWGGALSYWRNEADTVSKSKPKVRQLRLAPNSLMSIMYATDDLLDDNTTLAAAFNKVFQDEITFKLEDAILNGTGAGQALGVLNSPALIVVDKDSADSGPTVSANDVLNMWSRCWPACRKNAVWLINPDIELPLYGLSIGTGARTRLLYVPDDGDGFGRMLGRPVIPVEYAATLGTPGDIVLADLSQYLVTDKGAPDQNVSIHVEFVTDESVFRSVYRVDGQPSWNKPLTPKNGTQTSSPYVALAARA